MYQNVSALGGAGGHGEAPGGMEGDGQSDGASAARAVGGAGRWARHGDGKAAPEQLGTYPSRRAAQQAVATSLADGEPAVADRASVAWLVDRWVVSRNDVGLKATMYVFILDKQIQ